MNIYLIVITLAILGLLIKVSRQLNFIIKKQKKMSTALENLQAAVEAENTVIASVETLLTTLKTELDAALASNDTTALQALSDEIGAKTAELAAAVTANTPTP